MHETRSAQLRRQQRRIYAWSFAAAVALHAAVLVYGFWVRPEPGLDDGTRLVEGATSSWGGTPVRVFFAPPEIIGSDGSRAPADSSRVLSAERRLTLGPECRSAVPPERDGAVGEVRLTVNDAGRVDSVQVTRSSGSHCWDRALAAIAGDLWYQWLPTELHPAPVGLFQPVALTLSGY